MKGVFLQMAPPSTGMDTEKQELGMTNILNISTFESTRSTARGGAETVEVTLRNDTRPVPASRGLSNPEQVTACGMTGRYQTGSKARCGCSRSAARPAP